MLLAVGSTWTESTCVRLPYRMVASEPPPAARLAAAVICLVTFSVASSYRIALTVGNVFYTIALLSLQRVYVSQYFVYAVSLHC